jgi:hypothetical protein
LAKIISVKINKNEFSAYGNKVKKAYNKALDESLDDLVRTASQSAPKDEGILEKAWTKSVVSRESNPVGTVSFTVKKGKFNYALFMHEGVYNLGAKSQAKSGGTGMSGKTYPVGAGFLGGVLKGEEATYRKHIINSIKKV